MSTRNGLHGEQGLILQVQDQQAIVRMVQREKVVLHEKCDQLEQRIGEMGKVLETMKLSLIVLVKQAGGRVVLPKESVTSITDGTVLRSEIDALGDAVLTVLALPAQTQPAVEGAAQ